MSDLWPEDIGISDIKPPVAILREQITPLSNRTRNLVTADVETTLVRDSHSVNRKFAHVFYLVAPPLDNYHYRLFEINHDISLYPISMVIEDRVLLNEFIEFWDATPADVLENIGVHESVSGDKTITLMTEADLMETLKTIFGTARTKQIIGAMLSQAINSPIPESPF